MKNLLVCEICGYTAKQLFQHLKAVHNISISEYRNTYNTMAQSQIGFNPPIDTVDEFISDYVKRGWDTSKDVLNNIIEIYNLNDTILLLSTDDYYKNYFGKAKNRTLLKENPKLYKSIYYHTEILEKAFKRQGGIQ